MFQETQADNVNDLLARLGEALEKKKPTRGREGTFRRAGQVTAFARINPDLKAKLDRFLLKRNIQFKNWLMHQIEMNCNL